MLGRSDYRAQTAAATPSLDPPATSTCLFANCHTQNAVDETSLQQFVLLMLHWKQTIFFSRVDFFIADLPNHIIKSFYSYTDHLCNINLHIVLMEILFTFLSP